MSETERDNKRVAKANARLERAERRLARAQNEWQKSRAAMKALAARLDKKWTAGVA